MTISAEVIADSISPDGVRITTFELEYPRFIHAELMTHRAFSRNAASSRAIPVARMIELVKENPAMPNHWGKNQPGMQAKEECDEPVSLYLRWEMEEDDPDMMQTAEFTGTREEAWLTGLNLAVEVAEGFATGGYHKQIVNRLLEPFTHIKVVVTATSYDNWWWLRKHPDAQPEINDLAEVMWEVYEISKPVLLDGPDDWHLPYYKDGYLKFENHDHWEQEKAEALAISASCCAQVSYRKLDTSPEKAAMIYKRLIESTPCHASPFEHQASPTTLHVTDMNALMPMGFTHIAPEKLQANDAPQRWEIWSGNFRGWIQHRQMIPGNVCTEYTND